MNNQELTILLTEIEDKANNAIDKLIVRRQNDVDKAFPRYIIKKLEIIIGAVHRAQDKMPVEFKI